MLSWPTLVIVVVLCTVHTLALRKQGVAVRGKLMCGNVPANNTKVRIVDIDTGPDPDDTLDEKRTDAEGKFELNGWTRELSNIDPVLYVWHDCDDGTTPCQRKVTFVIPKKFIHNGTPQPEQWLDIGVLNLEGQFDEEDRECAD